MSFRLRVATFRDAEPAIRSIRETVFVEEQDVPLALEWDGLDDACLHIVAETETGEPIGTGRLTPDGHIGRMAVLREWRGRGVGEAVLTKLVELGTERGHRELVLDAQTHAIGFYARRGFVAEGEVFMDAGIPHRKMVWRSG